MKNLTILIFPLFLISCSSQDLIEPNTNDAPKCETGKYREIFSGDKIIKTAENTQVEIIHSQNGSKKICVISGEIKILSK